jgi:preprotein translocase subunit SecE
VARDRKRAKQRRERRARGAGTSSPGTPARADVPGALDHASSDADEFDAALVAGAGGTPVVPDPVSAEDDPVHLSEGEVQDEALSEGDIAGDELEEPATGARRAPGSVSPEQASGAPIRGGSNRVLGFLRASWAELQRVQWPDRPQVFQATAVVLGFVAIAGAYLGLADFVAKEIVEFVL